MEIGKKVSTDALDILIVHADEKLYVFASHKTDDRSVTGIDVLARISYPGGGFSAYRRAASLLVGDYPACVVFPIGKRDLRSMHITEMQGVSVHTVWP